MPYIHRLAIMPTTFRLLFYAILDAKEISKVAVASNASRFAMFSKSVTNLLPHRFFSFTTFGVVQIFMVVFVCRNKNLDFGRFPPFVYML